jgi:hypothetical protein
MLALISIFVALLSAVGLITSLAQPAQRRRAWHRSTSGMWQAVRLRVSELARRRDGELARQSATSANDPPEKAEPATSKEIVTSASEAGGSREPAPTQAETLAEALRLALDQKAEAARPLTMAS